MLIAPHPALNQLIGVMLGMALAVGDMANAWQEQHLPILHVAASAGAKVAPGATHAADTRPVRRSDPATRDRDLILAAQAGNTMAIQSLLAEGASLKARDADGRTALIAAVMAHMGRRGPPAHPGRGRRQPAGQHAEQRLSARCQPGRCGNGAPGAVARRQPARHQR